MEDHGTATIWFSASAADNHWNDLHQLLNGGDEPGDEVKKAAAQRNFVRDNPHIVDTFFYHRVEALFQAYFSANGIDIEYYWFRIEFQKRGAAHIHGCLKVKDDPGLANLASQVLDGRIVEHNLVTRNQLPANSGFDLIDTCDDVWLPTSKWWCRN
jgi:hypothetical protein